MLPFCNTINLQKRTKILIFKNFDNVPGLACYKTHTKINPNLNKILEALRTPNSDFEKNHLLKLTV